MATRNATRPDLDLSYYEHLTPQKLAFFKQQTGLEEEELKDHLLRIQAKSYEVFRYPCIRNFGFTELRCTTLPAYEQAIKLGKERHGAIFLEVGCCFGTDLRKAAADGIPVQNMIGTDLRGDFWKIGHELFKSNPETWPVPFIAGDVFDSSHIAQREPAYTVPNTAVPALNTLTSLNPLYGHVSILHTSSVFHLFSEKGQFEMAKALGSLLSPLPGSIILGSHGALPEKGFTTNVAGFEKEGPDSEAGDVEMFCHSPESWTELWDGQIFKKGTVKVETELRPLNKKDSLGELGPVFYLLFWSVTRL
ncbi:hypothetical protein HGRIS_011571 [Hohenbuehelia grisea]|uniref:Methyltransferase domain-containing protein n=1 Tax=Hohenbuehelia grisea TaxID=104357 RepID=A0ABR3JXR5_9AGAR